MVLFQHGVENLENLLLAAVWADFLGVQTATAQAPSVATGQQTVDRLARQERKTLTLVFQAD